MQHAWPIGQLTAPILAAVLTLLGAAPRVMLAAGSLPGWARPFVWSDVLHTWERSLGGVPYWQSYFEYPPLTGYIAGLITLAATSAVGYVLIWALVQAAIAALIAHALAAEVGTRRAILFAGAPQLALFGSLNFDLLAVLPLVLAVLWARRGRAWTAAGALAVGAAAKLFPAIAIPTLLARDQRRAVLLASMGATLLALLYAPSALAPYSSLESITRYTVGIRANIDSVWGLIAAPLAATGVDPGIPLLVLTVGGLLLTYGAVLRRSRGTADAAVPMLLAVVSLLIWSRLFSPQYSLWVLPFFALVRLPARAYLLLLAADAAVFLTVYPLTLVPRSPSDPIAVALLGALAAAVVVRHIALISVWRAAWRLTGSGSRS